MPVYTVFILIFVSVMRICTWTTWAAEYKVDVIVVDSSPLVGDDTAEQYRAYLPWNRRSAAFIEVGRTSNTGTGEVGQGYMNPRDGATVPQGSGLQDGTEIAIDSSSNDWKRIRVTIPRSRSLNRIGVFYVTTEYNSNRVTIPIIKMSQSAKITPDYYTKTIGIGESVTLTVTSTVNNVRWVHNNGDIITDWNDQTEVTIHNVRMANAGIFECFEEGKREMGEHAIMRLIVRACPSPKYGQDCSINCETCWNGGICAADNGICLCQSGFSGTFCGQRDGSNRFGASAYIPCGSANNDCDKRLFCGPDPIGCSCVAGYTGLDCTTACTQGWYGSNCNMECHCDVDDCDNAIGCVGSNCNIGFGNAFCQGYDECSQGYFGEQCEFTCHCHEGEGCDKDNGVCNNGKCAYGWGGVDCQQALPYFYNNGHISANATGATVLLAWADWNQAIDYGTGPVDHYKIYFWKEGESETSSQFQTSTDSNEIISDLSIESVYNFAVAAVRTVNGEKLGGPRGRYISTTIQCEAPGTVESVQFQDNNNILTWDEPESTCVVIGYSVIVTLINLDQCEPTNRQVADSVVVVPNITLPETRFFSTYQVSIQARSGGSSFATGGANTMKFKTQEAAPSGPPQKVRNRSSPEAGQITFTWDLPLCGQRNGRIVRYEYEYWVQSLKNYVQKGSTTRGEITLSGLLSNETYVFQVRAYTKQGPGPYSELYLASASGSTSDFRLIAITTPLAIITVIAVILVVFLLIHRQTCCKHCFRDTRTPQPQPAVPNVDNINKAYEDLDQGTLEKQQAYMDLGDPYLTPISESMTTETRNQQSTDDDERYDNVRDSVTYEDI
ncbi:uncharacterized protein [Amphiura filiformis]|uniref:uncharacterized protein n=1 Tax=Amphiura filiformis TaxID=82378 RepID=UPI003B222DC5